MVEEKINKKHGIPKILKKVIENELKKCWSYAIYCGSFREKNRSHKMLEEEIVELGTNAENMSQVINEGTWLLIFWNLKYPN